MKALSLSDLFYEISGIKPERVIASSDSVNGTPRWPERYAAVVNPTLAEYRVRQFLRKEHLTRQELQFDRRIEAFARYADLPSGQDAYQEAVWRDLVSVRAAEGWGNRSAKRLAYDIRHSLRPDHSLFCARARLFCDMVMTSAGQDVTVATPAEVRAQARRITRGFLAQRDYLTAAVCLLLEAMLASTQATADCDDSHVSYAVSAIKASEDLLVGRPREYDRRLINLVLFQGAAYGTDIAVTARDERFGPNQLSLLQDAWHDAAGDDGPCGWLELMLLRSESNYYLFSGEYDRCAACLSRACSLYDRMDQNLPYLGLLLRICEWAGRVRPRALLYDALQVYIARWKRNPRLSHLTRLLGVLGPSAQKLLPGLAPTYSAHPEFGARVAVLAKETALLRL